MVIKSSKTHYYIATSGSLCKGLPTGSLTAVSGSSEPVATITLYNSEERPAKVVSSTHLSDTYDVTTTSYTLDGQPLHVLHKLIKGEKTYTDEYHYGYDGWVDAIFNSSDDIIRADMRLVRYNLSNIQHSTSFKDKLRSIGTVYAYGRIIQFKLYVNITKKGYSAIKNLFHQ